MENPEIDATQWLQTLMAENYQVRNLKGTDAAAFRDNILGRIGRTDLGDDVFTDPEKQRDFARKYCWGHNHDFGDFNCPGIMKDRPVKLLSMFIGHYGLPRDLSGKKVLDIGVWTGGTSLLLAAMGAEVTACEEVPMYADTINYLAQCFGLDNLECHACSLYDLDFHDEYDYVLYPGVIYHLSDPILSLRILYNALRDGGSIFVESHGYDHAGAVCVSSHGLPSGEGTAENLSREGWNYFIPSKSALTGWVHAVGFEDVRVGALTKYDRLYVSATRTGHTDLLRAGLSRPDIR